MESDDEFGMQDADDDFYSGGDYSDAEADANADDGDVADFEFIDNISDEDPDALTSHRHQQNYSVLSESDIGQRQEDDMARISTVLSISKVSAAILLRYYHWNVGRVHDEWFEDEEKVRKAVGLPEKAMAPFPCDQEVLCNTLAFFVQMFFSWSGLRFLAPTQWCEGALITRKRF